MSGLDLWVQLIIIFICNLLFIYFRTLNVTYNATANRLGVFWTGICVHRTWLLSTTLGVNALLEGNYWLVFGSLAGGLLGADWAITKKFHK